MKNLFIALALIVSSISLFSCTKDDSDLAQEDIIVETDIETFAKGGTKQIPTGE